MYYRALEDISKGDHVASSEGNKLKKCNDPAETGYLGIIQVDVAENKKVSSEDIIPIEVTMVASIEAKPEETKDSGVVLTKEMIEELTQKILEEPLHPPPEIPPHIAKKAKLIPKKPIKRRRWWPLSIEKKDE